MNAEENVRSEDGRPGGEGAVEEGRAATGGSSRRLQRLLRITGSLVWLLVGILVGSATLRGKEGKRVLVDMFVRPGTGRDLVYLGDTSIEVTPGEEFRFHIEDGREVILLFCADGTVNPCGLQGPLPRGEADPGGEYTVPEVPPLREPTVSGRSL